MVATINILILTKTAGKFSDGKPVRDHVAAIPAIEHAQITAGSNYDNVNVMAPYPSSVASLCRGYEDQSTKNVHISFLC